VEVLSGDASKAKKVLGWRRRYNFEDLAKEMIAYDLGMINSALS